MIEENLLKYVGSRIKEERTKRKITQKQLGEKIGVAHNTIATYEAGRNAPEQNTIFKIAQALEIGVDDLFPPKDQPSNELERVLMMTRGLEVKDIELLRELIEKTLSLKGEEREKFLESIKFTFHYYENMN